MSEMPSKAGFLLVASPALADPNFARAVVLTITHDNEGSFGVVLNRSLDRRLADVLPEVDPRGADIPLFQGGPVQTDLLQVLSGASGVGREIVPGVCLGSSLDELLEGTPDGRRLKGFVGYAGWGAAQLEQETADGSWIIAPARAEHVFDVPAEELWSVVLRELGGQYRWLSMEGGEPEVN